MKPENMSADRPAAGTPPVLSSAAGGQGEVSLSPDSTPANPQPSSLSPPPHFPHARGESMSFRVESNRFGVQALACSAGSDVGHLAPCAFRFPLGVFSIPTSRTGTDRPNPRLHREEIAKKGHWQTTALRCVTFGLFFPKKTRCGSGIEFKDF